VHVGDLDGPPVTVENPLSGRAGRVLLVLVLALAAVLEARVARDIGERRLLIGIILNLVAVALLLTSRRWPAFAALATTLITVALLSQDESRLCIVPFCALLLLLAQLVIRRGLFFAAVLVVPFILNLAQPLDGARPSLSDAVPLILLLASLVVGESVRKRGIAVAALGATQEAMAESTRAQTVMEERARIARELHDIVAHHLSVIAIESEAARLTSPELSPEAGGRLESIASTAREALTETRRLLGVLREDTRGEADRAPQPGLDDVDALVEKARATGTNVNLTRQGDVARLPLSIDLAAYRIVQEALTNARRHAAGAAVDIEVLYGGEALRLRVRDHGPGVPGGELLAGHGLMGMRERATLAGGFFFAGPAEGGGFEVEATLPTTETT
jgi:signal transduction histidine kinase